MIVPFDPRTVDYIRGYDDGREDGRAEAHAVLTLLRRARLEDTLTAERQLIEEAYDALVELDAAFPPRTQPGLKADE